MTLEFTSETIEWRGPAPFVFAPVPPEQCEEIRAVSPLVTYGWGVIPATVTIGASTYPTSLFPRNGGYLVPVKVAVQRAESVGVGQLVTVRVEISVN
jgi:hypothetical protein